MLQDLNRILKIYRRKFFAGALSSGTAAIHLGLILLGVKAGDEVLCQSMTLLLQLILFYI
jgi:dTDP-4-amino-4,6-dideoxygalactose transaminase